METNTQPTRSCQTCRTRRIKCDGAKPICQRCIKSQRPCVEAAAAKSENFIIHSENEYATGAKRRPRGPRSSLVPLQPSLNLQTRAHAYYVQNHFTVFQDIPDMSTTWTECFHEWKATGKTSEVVNIAFDAVALAVFGVKMKEKDAVTESSKAYVKLLKKMQSGILRINSGTLDADEIDAYLLTAYFMARYESFIQQNSDSAEPLSTMKLWFHFDGAGAILQAWNANRWKYTPSVVIKQARRLLIRSSLLRERQPGWLEDGAAFGETDIALSYDRFVIQIMQLYDRYQRAAQASVFDPLIVIPEIDALAAEARSLDAAFQNWSTHLPTKWFFRRHLRPETDTLTYPNDISYSPEISSCAKLGYTAVWTEYFALRMLLTNTRLRIFDLDPTPTNSTFLESLTLLAELTSSAETLASFIPFCLDDVRISPAPSTAVVMSHEPFKPYLANLVVWPLALASSLHKLDPVLQRWFCRALRKIATGSSECLVAYALSDYWVML
ncbi:hypothetical protein N0V90_005362 [Kalmusia sp. IMI 367209]|nr:hypothetical protein N0V90_005362 [Kalmusia sp. IMI 367209]